jgi:hypothetical protein
VITVKTLKKHGYTGDWYIVIDDTDKQQEQYKAIYGNKIIIFNKKKYFDTTEKADNFHNMRSVTYARNACYDIADNLGLDYFILFEDDYLSFMYRGNPYGEFVDSTKIKSLSKVLESMLKFYINTDIASIAMAQGGDYIGGVKGKHIELKRKCMNSFILSTKRKVWFTGTINDDVNTYVNYGSQGRIFFTLFFPMLTQVLTQKAKGGMSENFIESGTYVKSFYTVIYNPSSVKIGMIRGQSGTRIHHSINWEHTVPKIIAEKHKK